ncbi:uridine kinase [Marinomonas ushuaiensis DSM 15871]|uniref:Uridine kinase n=1 Tax=Marinomonas ushuaiensis DSM 15871 TaxID=1122207 RepID=X7E385_9GAMM|nr:hypothetical protein [Marinomonas ushuaiensis]ETX10519.1 uridine kinase [Marinomonas ushuaiensis DSM 15871]
MTSRNASIFFVFMVSTFFVSQVFANASKANGDVEKAPKPRITGNAKFFGLPLNDLALPRLEKHLSEMGLQNYPSYKDGVVNYSLGPDGILGVTDATVFSNSSGYVQQARLSGVVESNEKRKALGDLLLRRYGTPSDGQLRSGLGHAAWLFRDGTMVELRNSTFDVSIMYVDERPRVASHSGKIDVEALSRKK